MEAGEVSFPRNEHHEEDYESELRESPLGQIPLPVRSLVWQYAVSCLEELEALRRTCHLLREEAPATIEYVQLNFLMGRGVADRDGSATAASAEQPPPPVVTGTASGSSSTWRRLERAVEALPKLQTLSIRNSSIRDSVLIRLVDRAGTANHVENSPLRHLSLSRCMGVSMSGICPALPRWSNLETLCLSNVTNVALPWHPSLRLPQLRHLALTNCGVQFRQTTGEVRTSLPAWLLTCPNVELLCIGGLLCDEMRRFLPRGHAFIRDPALAQAAGCTTLAEWEDIAWPTGVREHFGLAPGAFPLVAVEVTGVRSVDGLCQEMVHQCITSWRALVDESCQVQHEGTEQPRSPLVSLDFARESILDDIAAAGYAVDTIPRVASRLPESSSSDASVVMRCQSPPGWQLALESASMAVAESFRRTALHAACASGKAGLTEALLRLGSDPDVRDTRGNTPLCLAAEFGHASCAALLLGLPLEEADPYGPLLPTNSGQVGPPLPRGGSDDAPEEPPVAGGGGAAASARGGAEEGVDVAAAERYVRQGVWVRNNRMESPSLIAALRGHRTVLRLVLRKECCFPIQVRQWLRQRVRSLADGWTPLHAAALDRAILAAQDLVEAGYCVNATNRHGQTPLHVAARQGDADLCQFLCENGGCRSIRDVAQERPVDIAQSRGHRHLLELLRDERDGDPVGEVAAARRRKRQKRRQHRGRRDH